MLEEKLWHPLIFFYTQSEQFTVFSVTKCSCKKIVTDYCGFKKVPHMMSLSIEISCVFPKTVYVVIFIKFKEKLTYLPTQRKPLRRWITFKTSPISSSPPREGYFLMACPVVGGSRWPGLFTPGACRFIPGVCLSGAGQTGALVSRCAESIFSLSIPVAGAPLWAGSPFGHCLVVAF